MKRLVSACLLGINCTWKGGNNLRERILEEAKRHESIPVCPELFGGQKTPRPDAEIRGGDGNDVLDGKARVVEPDGHDVTAEFLAGSQSVLRMARDSHAREAVFKSRSPSCGCGKIYDGTFSHTLRDGDGVTTALLKRNGIRVVSDEDYLKER